MWCLASSVPLASSHRRFRSGLVQGSQAGAVTSSASSSPEAHQARRPTRGDQRWRARSGEGQRRWSVVLVSSDAAKALVSRAPGVYNR